MIGLPAGSLGADRRCGAKHGEAVIAYKGQGPTEEAKLRGGKGSVHPVPTSEAAGSCKITPPTTLRERGDPDMRETDLRSVGWFDADKQTSIVETRSSDGPSLVRHQTLKATLLAYAN